MTASLFQAFTALVATLVVAVAARFCGRRTGLLIGTGLGVWLLYVGVLGASGFVAEASRRPPGAAFILLPVVLFVMIVVVRSGAAARLALAIPLWLLMGFQLFRVGVELFLHRLWQEGLEPRLLTYEGGNVDIVIGLSAPLVAWAFASGRIGRRGAQVWNGLGLCALANIVARAILTAPGPLNLIHAEVPNLVIGTFPYTYVAGFLAPLAVILHVLAIRALRRYGAGSGLAPAVV